MKQRQDPLPGIPYSKFVASLMKPGAALLQEANTFKLELNHLVCGFAGELGELTEAITLRDTILMEEEFGDFEFYLEDFRAKLSRDSEFQYHQSGTSDLPTTTEEVLNSLCVSVGELVDIIKKYTIYDKPLDVGSARKAANRIFTHVRRLQSDFGFMPASVIWANKEKLSKRYASLSYSNESAINRADKTDGAVPEVDTEAVSQ